MQGGDEPRHAHNKPTAPPAAFRFLASHRHATAAIRYGDFATFQMAAYLLSPAFGGNDFAIRHVMPVAHAMSAPQCRQ